MFATSKIDGRFSRFYTVIVIVIVIVIGRCFRRKDLELEDDPELVSTQTSYESLQDSLIGAL